MHLERERERELLESWRLRWATVFVFFFFLSVNKACINQNDIYNCTGHIRENASL